MAEKLTERQAEVLRYLEDYIQTWGYPPSVRELAKQFGIAIYAASGHLAALERKGRIQRQPRTARGITLMG